MIPVLNEERDMLRDALGEERASREEDLHHRDSEIAALKAKVTRTKEKGKSRLLGGVLCWIINSEEYRCIVVSMPQSLALLRWLVNSYLLQHSTVGRCCCFSLQASLSLKLPLSFLTS